MKFFYADSLDYVDPAFDFLGDRSGSVRRPHEDDRFPHEYLRRAPYDGLLISRAIVGDERRGGKYSAAQTMRFCREGARRFLRYESGRFPGSIVMGDCGAFSYRNSPLPPYNVESTVEFYADGQFTHGCSVDHVVLDFLDDRARGSREARRRQEITLDNAASFRRAAKTLGPKFTALGVIQGWSAPSMANAAKQLAKMGYRYLAVGGLVPLRMDQIDRILYHIREALPDAIQLHLLGFGKIDDLASVARYGVTSFDTTSPVLRAFKDARRNYFAVKPDGTLGYYTAIRVPQAIDSATLLRRAKSGRLNQEQLLALESAALDALRRYSRRSYSLPKTLDAVIAYGRYALWQDAISGERNHQRIDMLKLAYARTLRDRPWEHCKCRVCVEGGIETLIFRSSNRNKRRGIHNLAVFYSMLRGRAR